MCSLRAVLAFLLAVQVTAISMVLPEDRKVTENVEITHDVRGLEDPNSAKTMFSEFIANDRPTRAMGILDNRDKEIPTIFMSRNIEGATDVGLAALFALSAYHKTDMENLKTRGICEYEMFRDAKSGLDLVDIYGLDHPWVITAGTQSFLDWMHNLIVETAHMGGGKAHRGFTHLARLAVEKIMKTYDKGQKITLVGHSMGGAVSILAGLILKSQGWNVNVFTFGSPRIGNRDWCDATERSGLDLVQVVKVGDPVVCTPRGFFWKYADLGLGLTGYDQPVCRWDWFRNLSLRAHSMSVYYEDWGFIPGMDEALEVAYASG